MNYRIAKPCIQDWSKMKTSDNWRFCMHCQKEVYDLTTGNGLHNKNGSFFGRIKIDVPAKEISFKKLIWKQNPIKYILFTSLLLFTKNIKAQITDEIIDERYSPIKNQENTVTKTISISDVLTDEKTKETIPFANVIVYDSLNNQLGVVTADIDGVYKIKLEKKLIKGKSISIKAVYVGYDPILIKDIPINTSKQNININMAVGGNITMSIMLSDPPKKKKRKK